MQGHVTNQVSFMSEGSVALRTLMGFFLEKYMEKLRVSL